MDDNVAWVGAGPEESTASLRVDSFSIPGLPTQSEVCLEDSTVCYYLEVGGVVQSVERCQEVDNVAPQGPDKVQQCDEEITGFTGKETSSLKTITII